MHTNNYAMFRSYFKIGWRNLLKNKGYSLINIGGLAMGMAVALLISFWMLDELAFNRYHKNYSTIGKVYRLNSWGGEIQASTAHVVGLGSLLRAEYGAQFDRGRDLPLYGWALAKQRVASEYLWLRTDGHVVDNPTQ